MIETFGIILVAVITSIVGPILVAKVKDRIRTKKSRDPIVADHEHCSVIAHEIEEVRKLLNADRAWILMFHNGGHFLTNEKSMKKFSMMFETCKDEKDVISHTFTNIPVSLYPHSTKELLTNKHIYIKDFNDPKVATYGLKGSAISGGTRSTYVHSLLDIKTENMMGSFGVDYKKKRNLTKSQIQELNERSQRIAGFLSIYLNN
jgi:hypothetical protein